MSDTDSDISTERVEQKTEPETPASKKHRCHPHASLYISIVALALAGYAVLIANSKHDNSSMQSQIENLDNRVSNMDNQLSTLSIDVQNNRENLVQTKLKKALENIRDIRGLAEEGTKAAISEVENMLQNLTEFGRQLSTPDQTAPSIEMIQSQQRETSIEKASPTQAIETDNSQSKNQDLNDTSSDSILSELFDSESTDNSTETKDPVITPFNSIEPEVNNSTTGQSDIQFAPAAEQSTPQAF